MSNVLKKVLGGIALTVAMAGGAPAATLTLSELFAGGTLVAGDKQFDGFSLVFQDTNDPTRAGPVNTDNIQVTTLDDGGNDPGPGLSFAVLNNEFSVTGTTGLYTYLDFTFGFRVSVLDPAKRISGATLGFTGASVSYLPDGDNDNGNFIDEKIGTAAGLSDLAQMDVELSVLDNATILALTDAAAFADQTSIWVTKNILVWATDSGDSANLSAFTQRFAQSQRAVPEPSSYALVWAALLAAGAAGRRGRGATS